MRTCTESRRFIASSRERSQFAGVDHLLHRFPGWLHVEPVDFPLVGPLETRPACSSAPEPTMQERGIKTHAPEQCLPLLSG